MYYVHLDVSQEQFCCLRGVLSMTFPFEDAAISAVFYNVQRSLHDRRNPVAIPDYFVIVKKRD